MRSFKILFNNDRIPTTSFRHPHSFPQNANTLTCSIFVAYFKQDFVCVYVLSLLDGLMFNKDKWWYENLKH